MKLPMVVLQLLFTTTDTNNVAVVMPQARLTGNTTGNTANGGVTNATALPTTTTRFALVMPQPVLTGGHYL